MNRSITFFDQMKTSVAKGEYVCNNPVRKGYVRTPDEWPWLWREWIEGAAGEGARRHT